MNMDVQSPSQDGSHPSHTPSGKFAAGNPFRWAPGKSPNPGGRPKGASFAAALARHAITPVIDCEELARIAQTIGLDPQEARNIDVVAALFYRVLCRSLLRAAAQTNSRADDKLVGLLSVLLKALDPTELRVTGPDGGPIALAGVIANVQAALGMRPVTTTAVTLDTTPTQILEGPGQTD